MATALPTNLFDNLFEKLIGSQTNTNVDEQLGVKNLINQLLTTVQKSNTTGSQSSNQNTTGTTQQTQSSNADVSALQKVFAQQQAGVTPDMLKAIFSEGAKAAPQLVASTANAVGARSGTNSPLATALTELNTNLTNQAATLNTSMLKDSASTAAQIAELTKSLQTTGATSQGTTGTQTSNQSTDSTTNQNTTTDQTQNSTKASDTVQRNTINAKSSAMTAGGALLAGLLGQNGGISGIGDLIKNFLGGGSSTTIPSDIGGSLVGFDNGAGAGTVGLGDGTTPYDGSVFGGGGIGDFFSGGWADGGLVDIPRLMLANSPKSNGPSVSQLLGLKDDTAGSGISTMSLTSANQGALDAINALNGGGNEGVAGPSGNNNIGNLGPLGKSIISFVVPTVLGMVAGPMGSIAGKLVLNQMLSQTPSANSGPGVSAAAPTGSVSVGTPTAADAETGESVGVSTSADSSGVTGDGVGGVGDTGDSGASGVGGDGVGGVGDSGGGADGDSGYANGGLIPAMLNDPKGIKDNLHIPVSGGEYVMPADVTAHPGVKELLDIIRHSLHTPAEVQRAA